MATLVAIDILPPPLMGRDSQTLRFEFLFLFSARSLSQLPFRLMPIRSYVRSTDHHRKSCGENIVGGIYVPVVMGSALLNSGMN